MALSGDVYPNVVQGIIVYQMQMTMEDRLLYLQYILKVVGILNLKGSKCDGKQLFVS